MTNTQKETISYIDNALTIIVALLLLLFPLVFSNAFVDLFAITKQTLLGGAVMLSFLLLGIRMVITGKVQLRSTPFDLPIFLFVLAAFLSAIFAINRYDALINFVPLLYAALTFYIIVNVIKGEKSILFAIGALVTGAVIANVVAVLSYFQIYVFPWPETQFQAFTPFGALLDQAMYTAIVMPFAGYIAWPFVSQFVQSRRTHTPDAMPLERKSFSSYGVGFGLAFLLLAAGLGVTLYMLFTIARPIILPLETGFQTAFASISQDQGRVLWGFLFGSGYGTYLLDFTRFKQATYNLNPELWSFTFFRSSSYVLELIATTGVLGLLSFLFIGFRFLREKTMFLPAVLVFIAAFVLPFSFVLQVLFFMVLGLFAATQALSHPRRFEDLEFYFVALKQGFIAAVSEHEHASRGTQTSRALPGIALIVIIGFVGSLGYLSARYILSDIQLKRSLNFANENNGLAAYEYLGGSEEKNITGAIQYFPYRDTSYRIFSQLNLALANSLAASAPEGQELDQNTQNTILQLIQQSITAGRNAVTIAPMTALNWNALSDIYRALIGFGQDADQFAIATNQEAIRLDPTNPQQYINLGGIFYQLQLWDQAQNQFQIAIQLKPDYANAYYNLGHALEAKGDLQGALLQYQTVLSLVQADDANRQVIEQEIAALQNRIGSAQEQTEGATPAGSAENQEPLSVNEPETQLPEREPEVEIEGPTPPSGTTTPSPSPDEEN